MWRYSENLRALYETPALSKWVQDSQASLRLKRSLRSAKKSNRTYPDRGRIKGGTGSIRHTDGQNLIARTEEEAVQ